MTDENTGVRRIDRSAAYREDGTRKSEAELRAELGPIGSRMLLLGEAAERRASALQTEANYPPQLFLSYKWGTDEENAWVHGVAAKLRQHGWDVICDAARDEEMDRTVEDFVSRLVNCRVFAAVIDPGYLEHAVSPRHPTWVFDEYQFALRAGDSMHLFALWREGEERPMFPMIFDLRGEDDAGIDELLGQHLSYDGPTLDSAERKRLRTVMERVLSEEDALDDRVSTLLEEVKQRPFVHGLWRMLVSILRDAGRLEEALEVAESAIEHVHRWDHRVDFDRERIVLLERLGRTRECLQASCELISEFPLDWYGQYQVGNQLDNAGDLWAARNHLLLACGAANVSPIAVNALGVVYLGLGFLDRAAECFEDVLRVGGSSDMARRNLERAKTASDPHGIRDWKELEGELTGCDNCSSVYFMTEDNPVLCYGCGAHRPFEPDECPHCGLAQGLDGVVGFMKVDGELRPTPCPTCKSGQLAAKGVIEI